MLKVVGKFYQIKSGLEKGSKWWRMGKITVIKYLPNYTIINFAYYQYLFSLEGVKPVLA